MGAVDPARELGIKGSTPRRRAQEYEGMPESAFHGNGGPKVNKDCEIVKLRKKAEKLVALALGQAVGRENPSDDFSLVFHDD